MNLFPFAVTSITLALVFYTVGVWAEKIKGRLLPWHVAIFWCGFAFDTLGTTLMSALAGGNGTVGLHSVTGVIAILLMLVHAVWATVVLRRKNEKSSMQFHKFSIVVWAIWLVPFISGMVVGMQV